MLEYPLILERPLPNVGDQPGRWLSQVRPCQVGIPRSMIRNVFHALDRAPDFVDRGSLSGNDPCSTAGTFWLGPNHLRAQFVGW